ncbi:MAG: Smr/MutS family protein [Burkholderiaceae bacterium]
MRADKKGLSELKRLQKEAAASEAARSKAAAPEIALSKTTSSKTTSRNTRAQGQKSPEGHGVVAPGDISLFRRAVKTAKPIKESHHALLPTLPAAPAPILRQRRESATGKEPAALPTIADRHGAVRLNRDETRFVKAGCGPDLIKGLKRGKWPIGASLDLHGATLDQARTRLDEFLESCITHQIKCVRVVHGKGYGSKDGASVLKQNVRRWLTQISAVLAYVECANQDGGAGAVQILLRIEH